MTKIFLSCTISVGLAPLANYLAHAQRMRRSVTDIYIYIYTHRESLVRNHEPCAKALSNKKHIYIIIYIYIYNYDEDFSPLYDKCGARAARQL